MEYTSVFCGTNLLFLDELQVNGEGDGNTEMILFSDICSDNDDSEVVREANSDHSVGGYDEIEKRDFFVLICFNPVRPVGIPFVIEVPILSINEI